MLIEELITPERTLSGVPGGSKKRLLETISEFVTQLHPETDAEDIFDALIERERLGSTGIGEGVAIPHCRLKICDEAIGILFTLKEPIDFDAVDSKPVDLVFALLVPEDAVNEHLKALQIIAERLKDPAYKYHLRQAKTDEELYRAAISPVCLT